MDSFFSGRTTTTLPDNGMYSSNDGGNADEPAPYDKWDENEAYNTPPGSDCETIKWAIIVLRAQIAWRYVDLNKNSSSYQGHLERIGNLEYRLRQLEQEYNAWCK